MCLTKKKNKTQLVRSVAQILPMYAMQTYLLSKKICMWMDAYMRDFWWGFTRQWEKHLYSKAWSTICAPKEARGFCFRIMYDINTAFVTKLVWQLQTQLDKLWVRVMKSKYCRGSSFVEDQLLKKNGSWVWSSIVKCKESFLRGACYKIG